MNSLVHFEIHASDPEKIAAFYKDVFGWEFIDYKMPGMEYWGVMTCAKGAANAINGGMMRRKGPAPENGAAVNAFVCTLLVEDIDALMKKAEAHGATLAVPKAAIPGMAWQGYMKDPDGNLFGLHQADVNAK
jgi:predicted enzyme related to lactoylglutathione lyase